MVCQACGTPIAEGVHFCSKCGAQVAAHGGMPPTWMAGLWPLIAFSTIFTAALALIAGYGLLNRAPWGRTVGIIAAIFALLKFPFGTALGIYTLWVLAPGASGLEYDAIADRS